MKISNFDSKASKVLAVLGNPFRIRLVLTLWAQEACVCHLEALLKKRQAYISQHLMALREANLLETRRDGKYIYYRLANPDVIGLIRAAAEIAGLENDRFPQREEIETLEICNCPSCETESSMLAAATINKNL